MNRIEGPEYWSIIIIISYIFTEIGLKLTMFSGDILEEIVFIAFLIFNSSSFNILFISETADVLYLSVFMLEMKNFSYC